MFINFFSGKIQYRKAVLSTTVHNAILLMSVTKLSNN